jgi:hypothetical protein
MVVEILREDLVRQKKYKIDFHKCKTSELLPKVEYMTPDVVISTAPVKPEMIADWRSRGISFFKGTPFLTGVGVDPLMKELLEVLDEMGVHSKGRVVEQ